MRFSSDIDEILQSRGVSEENERRLKEAMETFIESTYNKKLGRLNVNGSDQSINADSVVDIIRKTQREIRETNKFLRKLYNAESGNLWYRPIETEEIYTTIEPDYRQVLRKKYGEKLAEIREVDEEISAERSTMNSITKELQTKSNLADRDSLIQEKVDSMKRI